MNELCFYFICTLNNFNLTDTSHASSPASDCLTLTNRDKGY